jgi:hypothetical protein
MKRYFDKFGKQVKVGDKIRFTLYDGEENLEFVVRKDGEDLFPPSMKYLEFAIINKKKKKINQQAK